MESKFRTDPVKVALGVIAGFVLGALVEFSFPSGEQAKIVHVEGWNSTITVSGPVSTVVFEPNSFGNLVMTGSNEVRQGVSGDQ